MPSPYQLAREFRAARLAGNGEALARLIEAYKPVALTLSRELDLLFREMQQARARGEEVNRSWILRRSRLETLLSQVQTELERFGRGDLSREVSSGQRRAGIDAQSEARALVQVQDPKLAIGWDAVPTDAVESLVGYMGDGTPIADYFAQVAVQYTSVAPAGSANNLREILLRGVALGKGPRQIAKETNHALGIGLDRALTIARTETLRAYRTASQASYEANSDVVLKWRWVASLSGSRTCPTCLAMHGTLHDVSEQFGSHVNCRCAMVPVTETYIDKPFETGEEWLKRQPIETVLQVFEQQGPQAALAWNRGKVTLSDFVHKFDDPVWGTVRNTLSLKRALRK